MSQHAFGAMLGLSRATIARFEMGEASCPLWMGYAREGWRALASQRQSTKLRAALTEADVRRIVQDELAQSAGHVRGPIGKG
jgi:hypothetical protein